VTQRSVRDLKKDRQASRLRGARRGRLARYGLRNLPPIEEDDPERFTEPTIIVDRVQRCCTLTGNEVPPSRQFPKGYQS